jgi:hypothetical protein
MTAVEIGVGLCYVSAAVHRQTDVEVSPFLATDEPERFEEPALDCGAGNEGVPFSLARPQPSWE